jgi:hypothetical protein
VIAFSFVAPSRGFFFGLLAGSMFSLAACDSGLPKVYPVKGKVVSKGKGQVKDLAGYNVQFQSASDPAELPGGQIEEDGTFTLYTYTRVGGKVIPGVKEGTYRACLLPPAVEGGKPPPLVIPPRYTKFDTSNLEYTIKAGPNDITIEVDRDK